MMTINIPLSAMAYPNTCIRKPFSFWCKIFDPQSKFINYCNHFLLFIGIFSLYVDPLLVYLPSMGDSGSVDVNLQLGFFVAFLRVIGDSFLALGMVLRFRTAYEDGIFRVFGKRELVKEPRIIAIKYLKSGFTLDLLGSLPLPQVYLSYHIMASKTLEATNLYYDLMDIFQAQFLPRLFMTKFAYKRIEKVTGIAIKNPWSGTLYILLVYGMLSHYLGAILYYMYMFDLLNCRKKVFRKKGDAVMHELEQLVAKCSHKNETEQGLLSDAFVNRIGSRSFTQKYMFCFSWGLKTLSSMGQNLNSTVLVADTFFNLLVTILSLVVFADLIARMQTCMQSVGEQEERQMVRQRELEDWTSLHKLPPYLKNRVRQVLPSQLHATLGVGEEAVLDILPMDLRCDIRRHLYVGLLHKLPIFEEMDDCFLKAICGHLRTFAGAEGMFIVLEGDPVQQVLFVFICQLEIFSIDGESSSCITVGRGGFFGQELLGWSSLSSTSCQNLPSSTHTVKCLTDVEGFSLLAKDLKRLAIQFNYDQKFFEAFLCQSS